MKSVLIGVCFLFTLGKLSLAEVRSSLLPQSPYSISSTFVRSQLSNLIVKKFCIEDSPFKNCFQMNESKCKQQSLVSLKRCQSKEQSDHFINSKNEVDQLSEALGECVGIDFYLSNKAKLLKSANCSVRNTWQ